VAHDRPEGADDAARAGIAGRERRAADGPADPARLLELARDRDALADEHDRAADDREGTALSRRERAAGRDVAAVTRDRRSRAAHDDGDPGFRDRFLSGRDVDASAGDRADALVDERAARQDRARAREDRHASAADREAATAAAVRAQEHAEGEAAQLRAGLDSRTVIGQAQGLIMAREGVDADEALAYLVRESQTRDVKLWEIARLIVESASRP